jgi:hypothetical protein
MRRVSWSGPRIGRICCTQESLLIWVLLLLWALAGTTISFADDNDRFSVAEDSDRLVITRAEQPVAEFVFRDPIVLRPYFANVHAPGGLLVTRHHPPIAGVDATDHNTMHPGIWLGFGDISGNDFWRNKGRIKHVQFSLAPTITSDQLTFETQSQLLTADNKPLCELISHFSLAARPAGWLLVWEATFRSDEHDFTFGDQEEMGFGARLATPFSETNGGLIVNAHGVKTARATWGQAAKWCDYSGNVDERHGGITLMAGPNNFRESWWHNRDYGVFVANPFGRAAMKQGEPSAVTVKRGESFRLTFAALLHSGIDYDPAAAYKDAEQMMK